VGKWSGLSGEPVSSEPVRSEPVFSERGSSERGSVAAEFAAVIPAVILILAFGLTSLQLAGQQVRLQDAAADAARILGRGDSPALAAEVARRAVAGARIDTTRPSGLVCVALAAPATSPVGTVLRLELSAGSCALDAGG
jgi:Flp pilus assembly protein TadG